MRIDVVTIFPELVEQYAGVSIVGRARRTGLLDLRTHDPRDATSDVHRSVDDAPFGGGPGMVMRPGPLFEIVERAAVPRPLLLLDPGGRPFTQTVAGELAEIGGFSLLCGRYEGVDHRVRTDLVDGELSLGDVVLAGGELVALVVVEAVTRLLPGSLGNDASAEEESFRTGLLEHPQWTRPASFRGLHVPDVLRSGDHARVKRWRHAMALARTAAQRPDLLRARGLDDDDRTVLTEFELDGPVTAVVGGARLEDRRAGR